MSNEEIFWAPFLSGHGRKETRLKRADAKPLAFFPAAARDLFCNAP
jgi:hypothetical protein